MNFTLFKATTKANWIILAIFFVIMVLYLAIITSMFDPVSLDNLNAMLETLPKELVAAMGFEDLGTTLTSFLAGYYYGFLIIMFPMIYCIIVGNRLVAKHVDSGSMAFLLSTPNTRLTIVTTQALYLIASVTALLGLITLSGIALSESMFPGELDIGSFLLLNLYALLTFYAISGICFFFSCLFNDTKYSVAFGAGVPIAFFVLNLLANVGDKYDWLGYLSLFTLMNPDKILAGDPFITIAATILIITAVLTYGGGILIFNRKNLPI